MGQSMGAVGRYVATLPPSEDGVRKVQHDLDSHEVIVSLYARDGEAIPFTHSVRSPSEVWVTPGYLDLGTGKFVEIPADGARVVIVGG